MRLTDNLRKEGSENISSAFPRDHYIDVHGIAAQVSASSAFVANLAAPTGAVASTAGFVRVMPTGFTLEGSVPVPAGAIEGAKAPLDLARDSATPRALPALPLTSGGDGFFIAAPAYRVNSAAKAASMPQK